MRSQTTVVAFVAVLGLLATAGQAGAGNLDGSWIKGLFPGYFEAKVQGYRILFAGYRNGSLKGEAYGRKDQGHWFVKGDSLCVSWEQWTKGKTMCGSISQHGGWFVASAGGDEVLKFRRAMIAQQ
jgi:hypothetical protein